MQYICSVVGGNVFNSVRPYEKIIIFGKTKKMTVTEKYIIRTYSNLFDGLNPTSKIELLEKLAKSLKKDRKKRDKEFFKSFGAFGSEKPAEDIVKDIKGSRKFYREDLKL